MSALLDRFARSLLAFGAALPLFAAAQPLSTWNVQQVLTGGGHTRLVETDRPDIWSDGSTDLRELQRNETTIQLQSLDRTKSYLIDSQRNVVFADLNGTTQPSPIIRTALASGFTAAYVKLELFTPSGHVWGDVVAEENRKGGVSQGWTITPTSRPLNYSSLPEADRQWLHSWHGRVPFGKPFTVGPGVVQRTGATIRIPFSATTPQNAWEIDTLSGAGFGNVRATYIAAETGRNVGRMIVSINAARSGRPPQSALFTQTDPLKWRVEYPSRNTVAEWIETARTLEYVELRSSDNSVRKRFYMNGAVKALVSGNWYDDTTTKVLGADPQWNGQIGTVWENPPPGVSPGFQIVNKTDYPVLISMEQVGCLYYGIVQPGQVFQRDTGAVWFTIKATMAPSPKEPTDFDCVVTPLMYAATIVATGAATLGTAGTGTAFVLPAMLATAAGLGAGIGVEAHVQANSGNLMEGVGAGVGVALLTKGGTAAGIALLTGGPLAAANAAATTLLSPQTILGTGGTLGSEALQIWWAREQAVTDPAWAAEAKRVKEATNAEIQAIRDQLIQQVVVSGAYAGYPWPWPMSKRVMPRYDIVGGPRLRKTETGTVMVLRQDRPLALVRVN